MKGISDIELLRLQELATPCPYWRFADDDGAAINAALVVAGRAETWDFEENGLAYEGTRISDMGRKAIRIAALIETLAGLV